VPARPGHERRIGLQLVEAAREQQLWIRDAAGADVDQQIALGRDRLVGLARLDPVRA